MVHCLGSQKKGFILNPEQLIKMFTQMSFKRFKTNRRKIYFIFIHFVFIWFVLLRIDDARRIDIYYLCDNSLECLRVLYP